MRDPFWNAVKSFGVTEVSLPATVSVADTEECEPVTSKIPPLTMEELFEEVAECKRCRLSQGRNKLVFGAGNPDSGILLVGEGPGATEDMQGLPFVGRAGELLDRILEAIGLNRRSVYIANVVKCRPPGNRVPAPDEVDACLPILLRQIELMKPEVIVALGASAALALLGTRKGIGALRGDMHEFRGTLVMVTYHPAALLRSPALKRPVWEDMKKLSALLKEKGLPRNVV
ncbi:MAG: uracil-DNA glycosylase [Candidatus Fermentibacteraceae bacterium]